MHFCRPKTLLREDSPFSKITRCLRFRPHVSVFVWKRFFSFVQFGLPSTLIRWKTANENATFQKRSPAEIFVNAGFSFTYGWTKRVVFEYDDAIHHIPLTWRTFREGCYRISIFFAFSSGRVKWFEYATLKKSQFSKISGYLWMGSKPNAFLRSHWSQLIGDTEC